MEMIPTALMDSIIYGGNFRPLALFYIILFTKKTLICAFMVVFG